MRSRAPNLGAARGDRGGGGMVGGRCRGCVVAGRARGARADPPVRRRPGARGPAVHAPGRRRRRRLRRAVAVRRPAGAGDLPAAARTVCDAVAGFGPLQRYLDDPTVEEIWINEPGKVFVARDGVAELTTTMLDDGEVRDLVERMLKASGRRVDLQLAVRRRDAAGRLAPARGDPRRHARALGGQHPQVRRAAHPPRRPGAARHASPPQAARFLDAAVRAGLNILVAGGTQAGQDDPAELPGRRHRRRASGSSPARRSSSCGSPRRDVVAMQCRQPSLEGTGEIPLRRLVKEALRMRPVPHHRRRGAAGGEPRPAHRAEQRAARACAPSTPTAPARPSPRCARCRCWPARTSAALRRADRGRQHRPRGPRRRSSATARRRVREIVGVPGPGRGRRRRGRRHLHHAATAGSFGREASRRTPSGSSGSASTWRGCSVPTRTAPGRRHDRAAARSRAGRRAVLRLVVVLATVAPTAAPAVRASAGPGRRPRASPAWTASARPCCWAPARCSGLLVFRAGAGRHLGRAVLAPASR